MKIEEADKIQIKAICMGCLIEQQCYQIPDIGWVCSSCIDYEKGDCIEVEDDKQD